MSLLRFGLLALLVVPTLAEAQTLPAPGSSISLQSVNNPAMYVQHADGLGAISQNTAAGQPDATFKMVQGLTGEAGTVSFQSVQNPAQYLRHQGFRVKMQNAAGGDLFNRDATFKPVSGLSGQGTSFESVNFPGNYIRHCSFQLFLDNNQRQNARCTPTDDVYRQDVSFNVVPAAAAAAATAPAAASSPAMQDGRWQVTEGPAARHSFGRTIANGDNEAFLSGADIPAATATGWSAAAGWPGATSAGALQWGGPGGTPCRSQANYTYFQTAITPAPGMGYEIQFANVDDVARVTVMSGTNSTNIPEFIGLRDPKTIDLTPFLAPNAANRVVITLADVCGAGNGIRADLRAVPRATSAPAASADGETMTIGGTVVKTGNIQVTLEWDTRVADLDLFVTDPSGARVGYDNPRVASGGLLDVDARAGCSETPSTVENIVWQGAPPAGTYGVTVDHYQQCSGQGPVSFTATLRRGGQVVETWRGSVGADQEQTYSFTSE